MSKQAPKTVQLGGEQVPVLRRGTVVHVRRTHGSIPAGTDGRVEDLRFHGRGVQYLVDAGEPDGGGKARVEWVGGRFVKRVPAKRKPRRKAAA